MSNTNRYQDYAEDMDFSQSDDMEVQSLSDITPDDLEAEVKELSADAKALTKYTETLSLAIDGIGRFLLNEDGTVKDFTDKALMDATAKKVANGLTAMNTNAVNISNKIDKIPKTVTAELSYDTTIRLHDISDNLRWIIIVFAIFVVLIAGLGGYTLYQYTKVNERSENLTQWYEDNRESILFGRYVRWNNNDTWKKLHEKWESDPGLKDEMFDYFQMEERDGNIERK